MNYNDHKKNYYENGNISAEFYSLNNELHRIDGPAVIYYYKNSSIYSEQYCLNNKIHRIDGPAYIFYDENGNIQSKYYYLNDEVINVNSDKEFQKYIKTLILK